MCGDRNSLIGRDIGLGRISFTVRITEKWVLELGLEERVRARLADSEGRASRQRERQMQKPGAGVCLVCTWLMSVALRGWCRAKELGPWLKDIVEPEMGFQQEGPSQFCAVEGHSRAEWRTGWRGRA